MAAAVSPPPITVVAFDFARNFAISFVPFENGFISNKPMGPFHATVLDSDRTLSKLLTVSGPISRPIHPSGISSPTILRFAFSLTSLATTWSLGKNILTFLELAKLNIFSTVSSISSSTLDAPIPFSLDFRKVYAIAPPIKI